MLSSETQYVSCLLSSEGFSLLTMVPEISLAGVFGECMLSIGGSGPIYNAIYKRYQ